MATGSARLEMMIERRKQSMVRGFSILEMAVVLTVIALIAGAALSVTAASQEANRLKQTRERMELIKEAIIDFAEKDTNSFIPCAADPTLALTDPNFGFSSSICDTDPNLLSSGDIRAGAIPVRTLNIRPEYALDGWNRRIRYVMSINLDTGPEYDANEDDSNIINVWSDQWELQVVTFNAALVLVSHGPNGHGAWRAKGGTGVVTASSYSTADTVNSGTASNSYIQQLPNADYDDVVDYLMTHQINQP